MKKGIRLLILVGVVAVFAVGACACGGFDCLFLREHFT